MDRTQDQETPSSDHATTRRGLVVGATAGAGGIAAASLLGPQPALADTTPGVINAKDAPYGAVGDGVADDTAALQAALDDADNGAAQLYIPPGTYKVSGSLLNVNASKLSVVGAGMDKTIIRVASCNANEGIISATTRTDLHLADLTLDGNNVVNCIRGISAFGNVARKDHRYERVRVQNVRDPAITGVRNWIGIDVWPSTGVDVIGCEVLNCGQGIYVESVGSDVTVRDCSVRSSTQTMVNGIYIFGGGSEATRPALVTGNYVQGAQVDQLGNGQDGHGILTYRSRGARLIGNEVTDCRTSGILLGSGSQGAQATGNTLYDCRNLDGTGGTGIYIEVNASNVGWLPFKNYHGAMVANNWIYDSHRGIVASYCPGAVIQGNVINTVDGDGIVCDSQGVSIMGNVVLNAYLTVGAPVQLVKAGIRVYSGGGECVLMGNVCTDNQATKTQDYGIAVSNDDHIVVGNMLKGNGLGGLSQAGGGASNSVDNNEV